jgi:hypothetical protein
MSLRWRPGYGPVSRRRLGRGFWSGGGQGRRHDDGDLCPVVLRACVGVSVTVRVRLRATEHVRVHAPARDWRGCASPAPDRMSRTNAVASPLRGATSSPPGCLSVRVRGADVGHLASARRLARCPRRLAVSGARDRERGRVDLCAPGGQEGIRLFHETGDHSGPWMRADTLARTRTAWPAPSTGIGDQGGPGSLPRHGPRGSIAGQLQSERSRAGSARARAHASYGSPLRLVCRGNIAIGTSRVMSTTATAASIRSPSRFLILNSTDHDHLDA